MRACEQCGLSIGDTATFCAVCGARADPLASTAPEEAESRAVQSGATSVHGHDVGQDDRASHGNEDAPSRRLSEASLAMHEASQCEKTDPARAAALYREAILRFLDAGADPLGRQDVRHDLLLIFDRLSLVLKGNGLPAEALEEIDSAASLGLLDCQDYGVKGHREALRKRRESLHRALDGETGAASGRR